jgi:hypothetical protein
MLLDNRDAILKFFAKFKPRREKRARRAAAPPPPRPPPAPAAPPTAPGAQRTQISSWRSATWWWRTSRSWTPPCWRPRRRLSSCACRERRLPATGRASALRCADRGRGRGPCVQARQEEGGWRRRQGAGRVSCKAGRAHACARDVAILADSQLAQHAVCFFSELARSCSGGGMAPGARALTARPPPCPQWPPTGTHAARSACLRT